MAHLLEGVVILALVMPGELFAMPGAPGGGMGGAMHGGYGQPLAASELPVGTITVKVIGAGLEDKRIGIPVTLVGDAASGGSKIVRKTGADGRARFDGLHAGDRYVAEVGAKGRVARSQVLEIPPRGGLRVLMSLGSQGASPRPASSSPGEASATSKPVRPGATGARGPAGTSSPTRDRSALSLGEGTHLLGQLGDGKILFMQVLQLVNRGQDPVDPGPEGISIPLPSGAFGVSIAGQDKTLARVANDRKSVRVLRVLPPGQTTLRVTYSMAIDGARLDFRQRAGLPWGPSLFAVTNNNDLTVHGPAFVKRELRGKTPVFLLKAVSVGRDLEFTIDSIPFHDPFWRNLTLGGTVILILWAILAGVGAGARRRRREARREELLEQLVDLRARHSAGTIKKKPFERDRRKLMDALRPLWDE